MSDDGTKPKAEMEMPDQDCPRRFEGCHRDRCPYWYNPLGATMGVIMAGRERAQYIDEIERLVKKVDGCRNCTELILVVKEYIVPVPYEEKAGTRP